MPQTSYPVIQKGTPEAQFPAVTVAVRNTSGNTVTLWLTGCQIEVTVLHNGSVVGPDGSGCAPEPTKYTLSPGAAPTSFGASWDGDLTDHSPAPPGIYQIVVTFDMSGSTIPGAPANAAYATPPISVRIQ